MYAVLACWLFNAALYEKLSVSSGGKCHFDTVSADMACKLIKRRTV